MSFSFSLEHLFFFFDISERLDLSKSIFLNFRKEWIDIFYQTWRNLKKGTKGRIPYNLAPVIIYLYLKTRTFPIDHLTLVRLSRMNINDFKDILIDFYNYFKDYHKRDRKICVYRKIRRIGMQSNFGLKFNTCAIEMLMNYWSQIKNYRENIIAGIICQFIIKKLHINPIHIYKINKKLRNKEAIINLIIKNNLMIKTSENC